MGYLMLGVLSIVGVMMGIGALAVWLLVLREGAPFAVSIPFQIQLGFSWTFTDVPFVTRKHRRSSPCGRPPWPSSPRRRSPPRRRRRTLPLRESSRDQARGDWEAGDLFHCALQLMDWHTTRWERFGVGRPDGTTHEATSAALPARRTVRISWYHHCQYCIVTVYVRCQHSCRLELG